MGLSKNNKILKYQTKSNKDDWYFNLNNKF